MSHEHILTYWIFSNPTLMLVINAQPLHSNPWFLCAQLSCCLATGSYMLDLMCLCDLHGEPDFLVLTSVFPVWVIRLVLLLSSVRHILTWSTQCRCYKQVPTFLSYWLLVLDYFYFLIMSCSCSGVLLLTRVFPSDDALRFFWTFRFTHLIVTHVLYDSAFLTSVIKEHSFLTFWYFLVCLQLKAFYIGFASNTTSWTPLTCRMK